MFTGLDLKEIPSVFGTSEKTAPGDWAFARAWLTREVRDQKLVTWSFPQPDVLSGRQTAPDGMER